MLITTAFDFPGYEILSAQGEIFGITVRARNIGAGCIAGLRSIGGGEIPEFTKLLAQSRNEAMARMVEEAKAPRLQRHRRHAVRLRGHRPVERDLRLRHRGVDLAGQRLRHRRSTTPMVQSGQMPHQDTYELRVSEWTPHPDDPGPAEPLTRRLRPAVQRRQRDRRPPSPRSPSRPRRPWGSAPGGRPTPARGR